MLLELKKKNFEGFPTIVTHGLTDTGCVFIVMQKYGSNLKVMLRKSKFKLFSIKTAI